ncbi:MAG TPA: hypothetical protein VFY14_17320 [Streptomyces sp.]|nr:hypothetical protein [Streptomyces sp.]
MSRNTRSRAPRPAAAAVSAATTRAVVIGMYDTGWGVSAPGCPVGGRSAPTAFPTDL